MHNRSRVPSVHEGFSDAHAKDAAVANANGVAIAPAAHKSQAVSYSVAEMQVRFALVALATRRGVQRSLSPQAGRR